MSTVTDQIDALKAAVIQEEATAQSAISTRDLLITDQKGQIGQLGSDKASLQAQVNADGKTISDLNAKLAVLQPKPIIHDAKGQPIAITLPVGITITGDQYIGAKFGTTNNYALIVTDRCVVNSVAAQSDRGGIVLRGDGIMVNDSITNGCGQNGISARITNSTINRPVSHGNNTGNFPAYNEGGGSKFAECDGLTIVDADYADNFGVGGWIDSRSKNVKILRGRFIRSTVAGANVGKQVECFRVELSTLIAFDGTYFECSPGQNTAVGICDSDFTSLVNCTVRGQIGFTQTARANRPTIGNISITNSDLYAALWWDVIPSNFTLDGNRWHVKPTDFVVFIKKVGHTFADLQKMGFEKNGKLVAV